MQTAQTGDRVEVHYVKRFQNGSVVSSRKKRGPLELTVGIDHPRLPGLGQALVGLAPGTRTKVSVTAEHAYGPSDPTRLRRWARMRFAKDQPLPIGAWVLVPSREGHHRRKVRVVEVRDQMVIVDTNHRRAGQSMEVEVELIRIHARENGSAVREP